MVRSVLLFSACIVLSIEAICAEQSDLQRVCIDSVRPVAAAWPGKFSEEFISSFCDTAAVIPECSGAEAEAVYHIDHITDNPRSKRVIVFAAFHGDEPHTPSVPLLWNKRMREINSRNSWRFVPVLNGYGLKNKTRGNRSETDINRNFPTKDWGKLKKTKRRSPGPAPASEWETRCVLAQIESFKPELVVAVHAPYGLLDVDGPKLKNPKFKHLPLRPLGTFPGSLGRYLWVERGIPVITVELPATGKTIAIKDLYGLQDWIGSSVKK